MLHFDAKMIMRLFNMLHPALGWPAWKKAPFNLFFNTLLGEDFSIFAVPNFSDPAMAFMIPQANILTKFLVKLSPSGDSSLFRLMRCSSWLMR